jgi:hypothetical protein
VSFEKNILECDAASTASKLSFTVHYSHQWREFYPKNCH